MMDGCPHVTHHRLPIYEGEISPHPTGSGIVVKFIGICDLIA